VLDWGVGVENRFLLPLIVGMEEEFVLFGCCDCDCDCGLVFVYVELKLGPGDEGLRDPVPV
jgi:hypothetical protein